MPDLRTQLRDYFEEIAPSVSPEEARGTPWVVIPPPSTPVRRPRRLVTTLVGAATVVLALLAAGLLRPQALEEPVVGPRLTTVSFADQETLLSDDPRMVLGAKSPAPVFNTSEFGREVILTPITDVDRILGHITRWEKLTAEFGGELGEIIQVTVIGRTPGGLDALVVVLAATPGDTETNRCMVTASMELGARCGRGDLTSRDPEPHSVYTRGGDPEFRDGLTWEVPGDTSVVMLSVNGERRWQRPIGRVAVFDTSLTPSDEIELVAFDTEGNVLESRTEIAGRD